MSELADRPLRVPDETILIHWWRLFRWFANLRLVPRLKEHTARPLMRLYRMAFYDGLTRIGKIMLISSLLIFLFSYRVNSDFLLLTAAVCAALLSWSIALGFVFRPRVTVLRQTPDSAVAGELCNSQITIHNNSKRTLYNFAVREMVIPDGQWPKEWQRPYQAQLPGQQQTTLSVSFVPRKRGVMQLSGIAIQSYFPFFLTRYTAREKQDSTLYVLPETLDVALPSLRQLAEQASKQLTLGYENTRQGPALEYSYSRPYQTGDSLRRLDHRASSRYGEPMSKVFEGSEEIRRDQVYLMVDLTLQDFQLWQRRPVRTKSLDQRLALAVEIGLSAQNEGFSLAALSTGAQWHEIENITKFYQHIATCQPQRAVAHLDSALPSTLNNENGLYVIVTGRWTDEVASKVEKWQRAGIVVLVFLIAESEEHKDSLPTGKQFIEVQLSGTDS
ncbi:MAG: DUF58 domain-containing protein [Pseudomonadales bacterium]|nr:DUF58 domain-containing protein [Pseudomonadales bacterium]